MTLARGTQQIEGERIALRRIGARDLDYFAAIHADPEVARFIGAGNPRSRAETEKWLGDILESYERVSLGQLAVVRKSDGLLIGRCGLSDVALEAADATGAVRKGWFFSRQAPPGVVLELLPELGYTFGRENWGRGYASEAASCVYEYVKSALDFPKIMSVIHRDNKASRAVASKFAVDYIDEVEMAGRLLDRYHWPLRAHRA